MQRHVEYGPGWHDLREEQSMQGPLSVPLVRASAALALLAIALVTAGILVAPTARASAPRPKEATVKPDAPIITSVKVIPPVVDGAGGTATVTATLKKSVACQLKVVSEPMFKVTVPEAQACRSTYTAYVKLGANPTSVKRAAALEVRASNGAHHSTALLYISLQPRPAPPVISRPTTASSTTTPTTAATVGLGGGSFGPPMTTTTTLASTTVTTAATSPTTTTAPTTTTTPTTTTPTTTTPTTTTVVNPNQGVQLEISDNWSGYVMTGSQGYTGVQGTFTVPSLATTESCGSIVSQWVGLDGSRVAGGPGDDDLIQAGVQESANGGQGTCGGPNNFSVSVWWEILPQFPSEVPVTYWDNGNPADDVKPGDQVTVTIDQVSNSTCSPESECWGIEVQDDTSGNVFMTDQPYSGPGSSAEWIVEDPSQATNAQCNTNPVPPPYECPMPEYTPPVQFTGLGTTPSEHGRVFKEILVQKGQPVSIPSALDNNYNFGVSYTGGTQSGARGSATRLVVAGHTLGSVVPPTSGFGWRPSATRPYSDLSTRATLVRAAE
jgi:hypothetical protein